MSETKNPSDQKGQAIDINQPKKPSNGLGKAGFVLALIALFIGWIPILGWVIWLIGFVFSFMGIFKKPRGLAIAGLILSVIGILLLVLIFTGFAIFGSTIS